MTAAKLGLFFELPRVASDWQIPEMEAQAMNGTVRFATIGIVIAAVAAACGSSPAASTSSSVAATPSSSANHALSRTFTSPTMGFSVRYPAGWTITPASQRWSLRHTSFWDTPDGDRLEGNGAGFRGTSQALASGESAATWMDDYIKSSMPCGTEEQVAVGDHTGTVDLNDCTGMGRLGGRVYDLAVVVGGRGYNFTMEGQVDRTFWLAMLATVTFTPQSATDVNPPSSP